jgi:UDP-glucose 4-epimerase
MIKNKVLVTGGLGYIGSHTVVELIKGGYEVVIIDDLSNSQLFTLDNIEKITGIRPEFHKIDISNKEKVFEFFKSENNIDVIIYFAAFKAVDESVIKLLKYFRNNLSSLINMLVCMETFGVSNIVFSTSATVYGEPDVLPVKEDNFFKTSMSAYGSPEQKREKILGEVSDTDSVSAISLRHFNPVSAHESSLPVELPIGKSNNLTPFITQTASRISEKLTLYSNDNNLHEDTCTLDYKAAVEIAKAYVKSCDHLLNVVVKKNYELFNKGTGNGISMIEIMEAFEKYNKIKFNYTILYHWK